MTPKEMAPKTSPADYFVVNLIDYHLLLIEYHEQSRNQDKMFQLFYTTGKVEKNDIVRLETLITPSTT